MAATYLDLLKRDFPDSRWTALLADPNFAENARFGVHIEDSLYAATYEAFKADRFDEVSANTALSASRFPMGANRDKFVFIGGLSKLNNGDSEGCLADMQEVVAKYPESDVSEMAGMIINGVKAGRQLYGGKFDISDVWERRAVVLSDSDSIAARKFVAERNVDFSFMFVYSPDSVNENKLLFELARFNFTNFIVRNFDVVVEEQGALHRMRVSGFMSYDEALQYARQVAGNAKVRTLTAKARSIVISDANLELLGTQYSYNDYDKFYEQHFVPLRISTVRLLTEPATIEYQPYEESGGDGGDALYEGGVIEEGLFIDDEPSAIDSGQDNLIIIPDEQENMPGTTVPVDADSNGVTVPAVPESDAGDTGSNSITVPVEPESNAGDTGSNAITVPVEPEGDAGNVQDDNLFIIDDGQPTATQPDAADDDGTVVPLEGENKVGGVDDGNVEPDANRRPSSRETGTPPAVGNGVPSGQDDFIIEFSGDYDNTGNGGNTGTDDNRRDGFDLEDEYYDLDGF